MAEIAQVKTRVLEMLGELQPLTPGQIRADVPYPDATVNVALDRLQTDEDVTRRIIDGRIVYHLPDWQPAKAARRLPGAPMPVGTAVALAIVGPVAAPAAAPAPAPVPAPAPAAPLPAPAPEPAPAPMPAPAAVPVVAHKAIGRPRKYECVRDRVLQVVFESGEGGAKSLDVATVLEHDLEATKAALKQLRDKGLLRLEGVVKTARWFITDAGRSRLGIAPQEVKTESTPGVTTPAVQPIDTATSTAVPAAPPLSPRAVTEPAGPRDGLFDPYADFEPAADELLAWHAQRAEHEAARRRQAAGESAAVVFGDLNELMPSTFVLPNAMRNSGDADKAPLDVATSVLVDTASYALWSDGRLEIDAGDQHVTLSQPATRALLAYLDRVCAIEQH